MTYGYIKTVLFISMDRMPFLVPTLDNANLLFVLMKTPVLYLHRVEVADQDPPSESIR